MYARKWPLPLSPVQVSGITGILSEAPTITGELCSGARSPPLIISLPAEHFSYCIFNLKSTKKRRKKFCLSVALIGVIMTFIAISQPVFLSFSS